MIALRIDDIGASSKQYEVYSKRLYGFGNFLFLKYIPGLKAWGPYREINAQEWNKIFSLLDQYKAKLTIGITASWVESNGTLTPFYKKYANQAKIIKEGLNNNLIEIGIHGLTHCITENKKFLPKLFKSNRQWHREFKKNMPYDWHYTNLKRAKEILDNYFSKNIELLIPPGNEYSEQTILACQKLNIKIINCNTQDSKSEYPQILSNKNVYAFHDKEIVELGMHWFEKILINYQIKNETFVFISELAEIEKKVNKS